MPKAVLAVYTNPASADREDEFNSWYDGTHIPEVLALDGFVGARRYRLSDVQFGGGSDHRYVTLYEVDAPDVQAALQGLMKSFRNGALTMSDSMAPGPLVVWDQWEPAAT